MKTVWIVIAVIVVIAVVGYGGYRVVHHMQRISATPAPQAMTQKKMPTTQVSPTVAMSNSVYKMTQTSNLGAVMTDTKGMTLYTYDKDTAGVSNCSGQCLAIWPAYAAPSTTGTLPANVSVIKRSDGTMQYAWKGMPLYHYIKDKAAGDANGDMVAGVWHVIKNVQ